MGSYDPYRFDSSDPVRDLHDRSYVKTVLLGPFTPVARNASRGIN